MKKALNWCIVLVCTIAVLAGFAAFLPETTEGFGCFKEQVGCCYNKRMFLHDCSDGSHYYTCSGTCGPIP